jgi:hypothetical protein
MTYFKTYSDYDVLIDVIKNKPHHKSEVLQILDNDELKYHLLKVHFDEQVDYIVDDDIIHDIIDFIEIDIERFGVYKGSFMGMKLCYNADGREIDTLISGKLYEVFDYYMLMDNQKDYFGFFKIESDTTTYFTKHLLDQ